MKRHEAEARLKQIFNINNFYDRQWETIDMLLRGKRVLLVEKTGFGKSLCYQFPATQFSGITIIFSPLVALMRDQVNNLRQLGIKANLVNSERSAEENSKTIKDAIKGKIKILFIAPERMGSLKWIKAVQEMKLSMIVIDEAHTISAWGHDFRPAFRQIINLVKVLPTDLPVFATTATATSKVQHDIEKQISGEIVLLRGNMFRDNFQLFVSKVDSEDAKFLWIAANINTLKGNGIIYTGTRMKAEIYAKWLLIIGVKATQYHAGMNPDKRLEIENGLMKNEFKVVVSTNALGMGINKSDIRFIIHTQMPASVIHYYQEIGRAGRDGKPAKLILFYNTKRNDFGIEEDLSLPKFFLDQHRPNMELYFQVIDALGASTLCEKQLANGLDIGLYNVRSILNNLIEQEIIESKYRCGSVKYNLRCDAPTLNFEIIEEIWIQKQQELKSMHDYIFNENSRMRFLCEYLGDDPTCSYENCDNTSLEPLTQNYDVDLIFKHNCFKKYIRCLKGSI